eukprot:TRINITY_DN6605_c0_g1_i1.p1 TRINITY_DN6605_c0_g1~~TRINITY_DN6605_c0_g1_i1.p1  ORF type:complete len:2172 (+),score=339.95 TRINITY_DN6605_c0_g1_i1:34-6549(+)
MVLRTSLLLTLLWSCSVTEASTSFDKDRCDCCDEATLHSYLGELRLHCMVGSKRQQDADVLVVGEATDGSPSVPDDVLSTLCASPLCRSSVLNFWSRVRGCSEASSWKRFGFAWAVAKMRCMRLPQGTEAKDGPRYQALMLAQFGHDALPAPGSGGLEDAAGAVREALLQSLWSGQGQVHASPQGLRVQLATTLGAASLPDPRPLQLATPNAPSCTQTLTAWPSNGEVNVQIGLRYVVLHFDRCVQTGDGFSASLFGSGDESCETLQAKLRVSQERLPERTLIFVIENDLTFGCSYKLKLEKDKVVSCNEMLPLCDDVEVEFSTTLPAPRPKSLLVDDRWLRIIFDMPVQLNVSSQHRFRLEAGPEEGFVQVSKDKLLAKDSTAAWFHLDPSVNTFWVNEGSGAPLTGSAQVQDHMDGTGSVDGSAVNCEYKPGNRDGKVQCEDHKSFEVDMCSIMSNCPGHQRLPCGMVLEAYYPPGIAIRKGIGNAEVVDTQRTRECKPPYLLTSARLVGGDQLYFSWSEPAEVSNPSARLSLCKSPGNCLVQNLPAGDPSVSPCAGGTSSCAEWSLDLNHSKHEACGSLVLRVEAGAAQAVNLGTRKSLAGQVTLTLPPCVSMGPESALVAGATSSDQGCLFLNAHSFVAPASQNLFGDLHDSHIDLKSARVLHAFLSQLASWPCAIIPKLSRIIWSHEDVKQTLFDYVRHGGQLFVTGGRINRDILHDIFGLVLLPGTNAGSAQKLQTNGLSASDDACAQRWLHNLPVLNEVVSVKPAAMASSVAGHAVTTQGIFSSDDSSSDFGVLKAQVEAGSVWYLGFDWHQSDPAARRPWAMTIGLMIECSAVQSSGAWHHAAAERRLLPGVITAEKLFPNSPIAGRALLEADGGVEDLEVTIALQCEHQDSGSDRSAGSGDADASSCMGVREKMMQVLLEPSSMFYNSLKNSGLSFELNRFSPPHILEVLSSCPGVGQMDDAMLAMNTACNFHDPDDGSSFTGSVDFARSHMLESHLGLELLDDTLRKEVCRRPICRGMVRVASNLVSSCPETAGHKSVVARVVKAIEATTDSCLEVHSASQAGGSSDSSEVNHIVLSGVDTGSNAEMLALERAVEKILAQTLHLPNLALEEPGASIADVFDPLLGGPNMLAVSDTTLRVAAQVTPLNSGEPFDAPVSMMKGPLKQEIPINQRVEFDGAHNLHMLAIQPSWNEQDVDPSFVRIRVIFEDVVTKDNPDAVIRVFPTHLRKICMKLEPDSELRLQSFPLQTGRGELEPAGGADARVRPHEAIPIGSLCHTIKVSSDNVLVSGEVLQVQLMAPLMRNTEYVVMLPERTVSAAMGSTNFAGAKWAGWPLEEGQGNEEYTFTTGIPKASNARLSVAMSCSSDMECRRQREILSNTGMEIVAAEAGCFLAWFRCQHDPIGVAHCEKPRNAYWCHIHDQWDPSWAPPGVELDAPPALSSEPDQEVSETQAILLPGWVFICGLAAWLQGTFAALRAAWWVSDLYTESRDFDPFVAQGSKSMPLRATAMAMATPLLSGLVGALISVPVFCLSVRSLFPTDSGSGESFLAASHHLHEQLSSACCVNFCACEAVVAMLSYAVIARFKDRYMDKGQLAAWASIVSSAAGVAGGASGWIAAASVRQMSSPSWGLQCAVTVLVLCMVLAQLLTLAFVPVSIFMSFRTMKGMGDILRYSIYFQLRQWLNFFESRNSRGQWSSWVLFIREIEGFKGFVEAIRNQGLGDGSLFLNFYCSSTPFNTAYTRSHTVRYSTDLSNTQKFENEDISVNITDPMSLLVVDVMFQSQSSLKPERVATATWDPWTQIMLDRYFLNYELCNKSGRTPDDVWNPKHLFKPDGRPHNDVFLEIELNLTWDRQDCKPDLGVIRFQATHLGSVSRATVRSQPWSRPERTLAMGDTIPGRYRSFARRPVADVRKANYQSGLFRRDPVEEDEERRRQHQRQQLRQQLYPQGDQQTRHFEQQRHRPLQVHPTEMEQGQDGGLWNLRLDDWFGAPPPTVHRHLQQARGHAQAQPRVAAQPRLPAGQVRMTPPGSQVRMTPPGSQVHMTPPGSWGILNGLLGPPPSVITKLEGSPAQSGQRVVTGQACPNCGNVYMADAKFCRSCGQKREVMRLPGSASSVPGPAQGRRQLSVGSMSDWLSDPLGIFSREPEPSKGKGKGKVAGTIG